VFHYNSPPPGETRFDFFSNHSYQREIWQCQLCGHFVNHLDVELDTLYEREYVETTYGAEGLLPSFQRIMALPPEQSDNYHRVKRIVSYMTPLLEARVSQQTRKPSVLDVGSGLCVFPARMKEEGWECTALDPDPRAVEHAQLHVGVKAICGDFMTVWDLGLYDLITFNKVLEHVPDPVGMLS
jgi:2-polyprenyl-3-methyl-5-hydroxy-6-metoxy-1,4-benzoquinol methylase